MTREEWKDVVGYEGYYMVSNYGNVISLHSGNMKQLRPRKKHGYCFVVLYVNGVKKQEAVHRLVASAFIEKTNPSFTEVNHIDENPSNNFVKNLEWCDRKYNVNYGTQKERAIITGRSRGMRKFGVAVIQSEKDGREIDRFQSIYDASRATGINATTITKCCTGYKNRKSAGGYKWSYAL